MRSPTRRFVLSSVLSVVLLGGCSSVAPAPSLPPSPTPFASATFAPSGGPSSSVAPSPTVPSSPSPSTAPSPPTIAAGWHKVWPAGADANARLLLLAVLATTDGFVAVGGNHDGQAPAAISSKDGVGWHVDAIAGGMRVPTTLAAWGDRVLAVGPGGAPCAHPEGLDTWIRSPAGTWKEAPFSDLFCNGEDVRIAFVGDVAVLVGLGPGDSPVVWSSTDGLHWVDHGKAFSGLEPEAVVMDEGRATLIAAGPTATWGSTTADGSTWTAPAPIAGLPGGLVIHGVFPIDGGPTIIASQGGVLGTIRPTGSGSWTTTLATGLTSAELGTITAFDGGLLAVGGNGPGGQAWVSGDGASWRELNLPPELAADGAHVSGVAVRDGRAILVGGWPVGIDTSKSAIWTGPANLLAP